MQSHNYKSWCHTVATGSSLLLLLLLDNGMVHNYCHRCHTSQPAEQSNSCILTSVQGEPLQNGSNTLHHVLTTDPRGH
ncbi:hypothetical protein PVAP13_5NG235062 [Panicum virgatum]|uniref:Secreted protein n=1 Tax=Panicum virgatum TaxID=38727 RepID=A0A8T0RVN4_PANVG|nr:hypothetical protein PVAP13_5NG235062 [Panicum virgatum]